MRGRHLAHAKAPLDNKHENTWYSFLRAHVTVAVSPPGDEYGNTGPEYV